jgi:hypothetical protein
MSGNERFCNIQDEFIQQNFISTLNYPPDTISSKLVGRERKATVRNSCDNKGGGHRKLMLPQCNSALALQNRTETEFLIAHASTMYVINAESTKCPREKK